MHVGGGNTRSMLAVWREHGFEAVLREAWLGGTVLCGSSAGSICWFASGLTDSTAGPLAPMSALGFLTGSHCPHYDVKPSGALPIGRRLRRVASRRDSPATTARRSTSSGRS